MKIAVAGTGYVGLSIACLLSQHNEVKAVDIIKEKVDLINARKSPIQDDYIELFDPYYRRRCFYDRRIQIVWDQPKRYNRKILFEIFNNEGKDHYALGPIDKRECILIYNTKARMTMDQIEYMI